MSRRVVYLNGEFVPEREAAVSIFDSGLMFGDMAFEMMRTFSRQPFKMDEHLVRLFASLRLLEIDEPLSADEMHRLARQTLDHNRPTEDAEMDWWIMINVSRGPLALYRSAFPGGIRPTVTISAWPLITHMGEFAPTYERGVDFVIPSQQAIPAHLLDPKAKTRSRLHYQLAQRQAERMRDGAWPILVDPDGYLAEGTGYNVFLVKEGTLLTPEPRNILLGVTRNVTMDLAGQLGITVVEANLSRYDALQADEIFATASSFCLVHGVTFEGQTIGVGKPGPVFSQLMDAWKKLTGMDFVTQAQKYAQRLPEWEAGQ